MSQANGRIDSLDALRGFALVGILVVNIQVLSGWGYIGEEGRAPLSWSEYDELLKSILNIVAHGKFYPLFSLLFGYSFVLAGSKRGEGYHLRRMVGLLLMGLAHSILVWPWDILLFYAVLGVLLTPFLYRAPLTLLLWSIGLMALAVIGRWYWLSFDPVGGWSARVSEIIGENVSPLSSGTYWDVIKSNLDMMQAVAMSRIAEMRPVQVMAMFLLGAAAARMQLARPAKAHLWLLLGCAVVALPLGLGLAFAQAQMSTNGTLQTLLFAFSETAAGPIFAIAYAAILALWWNRDGLLARITRNAFAPAGRMALTNYIAQSAICVPIFYGFGLGVFAEYSLAKLLLFCAALIAAQLLFSYLWLRVFRQGPLEWLWRWQIKGSRPALLR